MTTASVFSDKRIYQQQIIERLCYSCQRSEDAQFFSVCVKSYMQQKVLFLYYFLFVCYLFNIHGLKKTCPLIVEDQGII